MTSILRILALMTNILFENRTRKVFEILNNLNIPCICSYCDIFIGLKVLDLIEENCVAF